VSTSIMILLLLSPLLLLVLMFGLVVIVALCQARPDDIPAVLRECSSVFRRLIDRVPSPRNLPNRSARTATERQNGRDDVAPEEAP
jgi:hypothetical protein